MTQRMIALTESDLNAKLSCSEDSSQIDPEVALAESPDPNEVSHYSPLILLSTTINCSFQRLDECCPLTCGNAFGFQPHHQIPHLPCDEHQISSDDTHEKLLTHLMSYHKMQPKPAQLILRTVRSSKNGAVDPRGIDLFSKWTKNKILVRSISAHVDVCPFTKGDVYGIPLTQYMPLCDNASPLRVYQQ